MPPRAKYISLQTPLSGQTLFRKLKNFSFLYGKGYPKSQLQINTLTKAPSAFYSYKQKYISLKKATVSIGLYAGKDYQILYQTDSLY
jgi:hypothetical protein